MSAPDRSTSSAHRVYDPILKSTPTLNGMALGFYEQNINGRRVLSHAGDMLTFHGQLWLLPGEKVGLCMSMNAAGTDRLSGAIRSHVFDAFADRYFPFDYKDDGRVDDPAGCHALPRRADLAAARHAFCEDPESCAGGKCHIAAVGRSGLSLDRMRIEFLIGELIA